MNSTTLKSITLALNNIKCLSMFHEKDDAEPLSMLDNNKMAMQLAALELKKRYPDSVFTIRYDEEKRVTRYNRSMSLRYVPVVDCEFGSKKDFNKFKLLEGYTENKDA